MYYYECPYCKRTAASYWSLGNPAFLLNTDKKCPHCFGRLRIRIDSYLLMYPVAVISLIIFLVGGSIGSYFILNKMNLNLGIIVLLFICSQVFTNFLISLFSKYWNLRLLLPKDNVAEHIRNLPSYLR